MNAAAQRENARMLATTLGIGETEANELLKVSIALTFDPADKSAEGCARHIRRLISLTIQGVSLNPTYGPQRFVAEIVIGECPPRFSIPRVFVSIGTEEVLIGSRPVSLRRGKIHPVGILLGACYAVGAALKLATNNLLRFPAPELLRVNLTEILGDDLLLLYRQAYLDEAHLAGAGAVGNGFLYGLGCFDIAGRLHVADDDTISDGNLQRCVLFESEHVGKSKARQLCTAAKLLVPKIAAIPHVVRLQDVPGRYAGPWLKRLIVGTDSPRARRSLQTEIPGEVFDASTTGISEIVLHFHQQPTGGACMSCVYHQSPEEDAHERHVAATLGVSLSDVMQTRISLAAAEQICKRYPQFQPPELIGIAYDTLFKRLCSTERLAAEGRQVLTPFAFVSVLAGTFLAIEFVRRIQRGHIGLFNEWRISPWSNPVMRRQRFLERRHDCEFCGNPLLGSVAKDMWTAKSAVIQS